MSDASTIDQVFARWLATRASSEHDLVESTGWLVSQQRGAGHTCVPCVAWSARSVAAGRAPFPAPAAWCARLVASGVAGDGVVPTPLVCDDGRLYLYRYWQAERRLATNLVARIARPPMMVSVAAAARFQTLFPAPSGTEPDWQAAAANCALRRQVTVVVGGPGTGKTTTVARLLALLAVDHPQAAVMIAAPTGKAAQRLRAALAEQLPTCGDVPPAIWRAADQAGTVHRLLGIGRDGRCRFGEHRPLPCDVLVVDEASMLDLLLMDALVAALPSTARLVLLGDSGQLASVEAGCVLTDLTRIGLEDHRATSAEPRIVLPWLVQLRVNHRSRHHPGLAALAEALRAGDATRALAILEDPAQHDVARVEPDDLDAALALVWNDALAAVRADGPAAALIALGQARLLCALNDGPAGVEGLNQAMETRLRHAGVPVESAFYRGRPLLITANDDDAGLFNGDLGVAWNGAVWFDDGRGGVRAVAPAALPAHRTAWAMTVHKAQGAEFLRVAVVLPALSHPLVTRELVYTAVTRAREQVRLAASGAALTAACAATAARDSGLGARLTGML